MKKFVSLLLVFMMVISMIPAVHAETLNGSCGDYAKWELNLDTGHLRIYGEGDMTTRPWKDHKWDIRTITIEPGITSICNSAFYECWYLENITVPDTIVTIGDSAFERATMASFDFPDALESIGSNAFRNCKKLQAAKLPANLKTIGSYAFRYCSGLQTVTFPEGLTSIGNWSFEECTGLQQIVIPDTVTYLGTGAFGDCTGLVSAKLSAGLTQIRERVFQDCSKLASVNVPGGVTYIGMCAFSGCSSLKRIKLPDNLATIDDIAFGWSGLEQIIIPASVTKIATGSVGNNVFSDCQSLKRIAILNPECSLLTSSLGVVGKTTIYCYKDSTAHKYAVNKGYNFEFLDGTNLWEEFYNPFLDVSTEQYYYNPVLWAVDEGITTGTSATTFGPDKACTRAQVVTFLWRAAGSPAPSTTSNPFSDVAANQYYNKAVLWAVEEGITTGTSATTFGPDKPCTRAQVVTFLYRSQGSPATAGSNNFTDVPAGQYYYNPVLWAVANGVTTGTSATTFAPDKTCTRGQIVTFLNRAMAD